MCCVLVDQQMVWIGVTIIRVHRAEFHKYQGFIWRIHSAHVYSAFPPTTRWSQCNSEKRKTVPRYIAYSMKFTSRSSKLTTEGASFLLSPLGQSNCIGFNLLTCPRNSCAYPLTWTFFDVVLRLTSFNFLNDCNELYLGDRHSCILVFGIWLTKGIDRRMSNGEQRGVSTWRSRAWRYCPSTFQVGGPLFASILILELMDFFLQLSVEIVIRKNL